MEYSIVEFLLLGISLGCFIRFSDEVKPPPRSPTDEEQLLQLLFDGYNPSARPVLNSTFSVQVRVQFSLLQIQELNLKSQVFTTTGLLILEWTDERLRWNNTHFQIKDIVVEAKKLWRPEFAAINGANDIYGDYGQFRAVLKQDGRIHWEPGGVFKTICEIDITYYPFDEQCCQIVFGAWSYDTSKMNLTNMSDSVNMDSFEMNGEWEIYKTEAARNVSTIGTVVHEKFSNVVFRIYIRRRYTFYILNVILPSIMTSILLLSVFFSTPAQKVQIGVVVLLSFRIFLLNVTDSIPKTSDHIPLLGVYLACTMAITTMSMVLTVYVLNLYGISDRPVPAWANKLVMIHMARLVRMQQKPPSILADHLGPAHVQPNHAQVQVNYNTIANSDTSAYTTTPPSHRANSLICYINTPSVNGLPVGTDVTVTSLHAPGGGGAINSKRGMGLANIVESSAASKNWSKDWQRIAEVVDRLFFWVFLTGVVITTLLLFHPLARSTADSMDGSGEEPAPESGTALD